MPGTSTTAREGSFPGTHQPASSSPSVLWMLTSRYSSPTSAGVYSSGCRLGAESCAATTRPTPKYPIARTARTSSAHNVSFTAMTSCPATTYLGPPFQDRLLNLKDTPRPLGVHP